MNRQVYQGATETCAPIMANLDTLQSVGGYNLDNNSYPDFNNSVFNLFSDNQAISEIKGKLNLVLTPERKITPETNVITYTMMPQPDKFLWPDSIRLVGSVQLEKKVNGSTEWGRPDATDQVTVINNCQQCLFSKVLCRLNDTEISDPSTDPYPYQSYFATTFNLTHEYKEHLSTQLFYKDTPTQYNAFNRNADLEAEKFVITDGLVWEETAIAVLNASKQVEPVKKLMLKHINPSQIVIKRQATGKYNHGAVKRRAKLISGTAVPFIRRIDHDIVTALTMIPPRTKVSFQFNMKDPNFVILQDRVKHKEDKFRLRLVDMNLEIVLADVVPNVARHYMRSLNNSRLPPHIDFSRNFIRTYTVLGSNTSDFGAHNFIMSNRLPDTIILGITKQTAHLADKHENPFCFQAIGFSQINLIVNGELEYPTSFESCTPTGRLKLYQHLQDCCGENQATSQKLDITYEEMYGGQFFIYFDRTKAKDNRATRNEPDEGNLSIVLKTNQSFQGNIDIFDPKTNWEVICFCVYSSRINYYGEHIEVTQFT